MKNLLVCLLFLSLAFTACKNNKEKTVAEQEPVQETKAAIQQLPESIVAGLFQNCTAVDYIFKDLPISVSQTDKPSIQTIARSMDFNLKANIDPTCAPMARQIFQVDGEIVLEADVFLSEKCQYYIFYKDNVAVYSNGMSSTQYNFLMNIIKQVKGG